MEGPLSKWTNVMQGWQYRWFVLKDDVGLFSYYTSKEKMIRGQQRGCVRLTAAVLGIDDENESLFTITVDGKTFHFQARDADERDRWIRALEITIHKYSGYYKPRRRKHAAGVEQSMLVEFDRKVAETDQCLQLMIEQAQEIESQMSSCQTEADRDKLRRLLEPTHAMLESVKHAVVLLQLGKSQLMEATDAASVSNLSVTSPSSSAIQSPRDEQPPTVSFSQSAFGTAVEHNGVNNNNNPLKTQPSDDSESLDSLPPLPSSVDGHSLSESQSVVVGQSASSAVIRKLLVPPTSYSSTDEEDEFFDASDGDIHEDNTSSSEEEEHRAAGGAGAVGVSTRGSFEALNHQPDYQDDHVDFDAIYEDDNDNDLGDMNAHGSVVTHLLSQVRIGMDLTRITLPTFILERRSLLEMYADFFTHPELLVDVCDGATAEVRMVAVLRYYLSAFYAARKSGLAKKPYNPVLGETFSCAVVVPGIQENPKMVRNANDPTLPFPGCKTTELVFTAEQVSHHPPVSAFYAELPAKGLQFTADIWTKSQFLGLSIGVHNLGEGTLKLLEHGETYKITFPSGYGRSIMTTPWIELGGKTEIVCGKSGYRATIEFLTKPWYGGKPHQMKADVFNGKGTAVLNVKGEWNGVMLAKRPGSSSVTVSSAAADWTSFAAVVEMPLARKRCTPVSAQSEYESRYLWRHVTAALKRNRIDAATDAKRWIEERQRYYRRKRQQTGEAFVPERFTKTSDQWHYKWPLEQRRA